MGHVHTVQTNDEFFSVGKVPGILACLAEAVEWEYDKKADSVPWLATRHGRAEVAGYFEALGQVDLQKFLPKTLLESGNIVVALNDLAPVVKDTGRKVVEEDEVHIWHFKQDGLVARFCHKTDTHGKWAAFRAS
jgi:uncharacterized protein